MFEQQKIITISRNEQKYLLEVLKAYKKVLSQGYDLLRKQKPQANSQIVAIYDEKIKVEKFIENLKNK